MVRQTAFDIHVYLGVGYAEKVYENALAHRLRKQGIAVAQQCQTEVFDEDGELLGVFYSDLLVDNRLIVEIKAVKTLANEHVAQILNYLRTSNIENGMLINFGSYQFQVKKLIFSKSHREPEIIS
ncbi:MAG: GxxExxY protein [Kiritimatiellaeota bacterium]|nr:GxxExxY protein [Kiritimatiellota bacterium]